MPRRGNPTVAVGVNPRKKAQYLPAKEGPQRGPHNHLAESLSMQSTPLGSLFWVTRPSLFHGFAPVATLGSPLRGFKYSCQRD